MLRVGNRSIDPTRLSLQPLYASINEPLTKWWRRELLSSIPPEIDNKSSVIGNDNQHALSAEQEEVIKHALSKHRPNMFISGQAGTGKSYLLCNLYRRLKALGNTDNGGRRWSAVALTATTGIAAINIGGITLHSWAGIPLQPFVEDTMVINNSGDLNEMDHSVRVVANYLQMPRNRAALWRWLNTRTLIIDECSLIHPESLDFIDQLARHLRNTTSGGHCRQSFGGMQLILCGDFMQLPPVIRQSERHRQAMMLAEQRRLMRDKFVQSRQYQLGEQQLMACNDALVGSAFQFDQVQLTADDQMLLDEQLMQWEAKQQSINGSSAAAVSHRFCFDAKIWRKAICKHFYLREPHRQAQDRLFIEFLNVLRQIKIDRNQFAVMDALLRHLSMPFHQRPNCPVFQLLDKHHCLSELLPFVRERRGASGRQHWEFVASPVNYTAASGGITMADENNVVRLFPRKHEVDRINRSRLRRLVLNSTTTQRSDQQRLKLYRYDCIDSLGVADSDKESISYTKTCKVISEELKAKLFQEMTLPARVELFLGAQVMLLKNLSFKHGLVNGSIGKVVDFLPISSKQFATAAASKTTSITGAPDDECDALLYGQSDWMRHVSTEHNNFIIHLPRVKFPGLANPVLIIPFMERLDFNNFFNETSPNSPTDLSPGLARYQIPLRLAYAYTIHKSQGQTLPLVEVDVRRLFEYGQAYVALSRATGFRGLRVVGYADTDADDTDDGDDTSPDKFSITKTTAAAERFWKWQVHQRVAEFYNSATSSS